MLKPDDHVLDHVDAFLNGLLSARDASTLEEHVGACPICRVALDEARKRADAMTALPPMEASNELLQRVEQSIDALERRSRVLKAAHGVRDLSGPKKGVLAAVVSAVLIASINIYYATLSPTPYNLRVLGQSEVLAGATASLRVFLFDQTRDIPLGNVPVSLFLVDVKDDREVALANFRTDDRGTASPRFRLPDWKDGEYELRVVAHPAGEREEITRPITLRREWKLMLSTDKPVYQPGQTIRLRSLALRRGDLKPVAGREVAFSVTDPKGNVIFRRYDVTSRFGIASTDCPLTDEILHGSYRVECRVDTTTSTAVVDVRKYVLPKFKINVELDRPFYQPGETVRGKVTAAYFFGKPVAGGTVLVEPASADADPLKLPSVNVTLDEEGMGEFSFRIPTEYRGRSLPESDTALRIGVTVTDSAGQKHTRHVSRVVTKQPIRVEVIPEAGRLVRGVRNVVYLLTTYPDGRPAKTRVAVTGYDREFQTDALGVATVELTPAQSSSPDSAGMTMGIVYWNVKAVDAKGREGRRSLTLYTGKEVADFLLRTDKAVYTGGETMTLTAHGGGNEPVFVDLIKNGQTVLTESIAVADGRGSHAFDLPPELSGTLKLYAYRFNRGGTAVRKSRVIHVRQARQLKITTKLDHAEYRPGRRAKLKFQVRDSAGKAVPGAISLSAVDAAVFSVRRERPGMEQTFFTLEQELLKPVYEVYPWSPGMQLPGTAGQQRRFEQAIFSRAATDPIVGENALRQPSWLDVKNNGHETSNRSGIHSLNAESYASKLQANELHRESASRFVMILWIAYAVVFGIALFIVFWSRAPLEAGLTTALVVFLLCSGLLLPAVQQSREAAEHKVDFKSDAKAPATKLAVANIDQSYKMVPGPLHNRYQPKVGGGDSIRVRRWFPETLLWRPELITDDAGNATLEVDLADSITTWRVNAGAVSADGRLGAAQTAVRVFQPFFVDLNLPVALTRGDEVAVPVVVYNYLDKPQTVNLSLEGADWFEFLDGKTRSVELPAGGVRSVRIRLRAKKVGRHALQVTAKSGGIADAVKKKIEVVPDGRPVQRVVNGALTQPVETELTVPADAIEGSAKTIVKIYPSNFSQLVEGIDGIFRRPYGCFEQTSSTTYPNVLALQYLKRTGKSVPAVEAKARQYIHLGYQRLLTFEIPGGGFDWFGQGPAKTALSAYGLMEFEDMARVHDVDPLVIERTRDCLLRKRRADGSWARDGRITDDLTTTAYIAWAVFRNKTRRGVETASTRAYLLRHRPASIDDSYTLALVCNALIAIDSNRSAAQPYLERLLKLRRTSSDGKRCWWESPAGGTLFYGGGSAGNIETTALATLALLAADTEPSTIRQALAWLITQRDNSGTWHSTQATILALQALTGGTGKTLDGGKPRRVDVAVDGKTVQRIVIPADQSDVMHQLDLSTHIASGRHRVTLSDRAGNAPGFQVAFRYHVLGRPKKPVASQALSIDLTFDKAELRMRDIVTATATVTNHHPRALPMVIIDLPIPPGFVVETEAFAKALQAGRIAKYQITPRSVILYLRQLEPAEPFRLSYRLRATMPIKTRSQPAVVYEYYNPASRATTPRAGLVVRPVVEPAAGNGSAR